MTAGKRIEHRDLRLWVKRLLAGAIVAVVSAGVQGEELVGKVVAIADGDTITVLDMDQRQHKVRLQGIDAPERGQDHWRVSKQYLSDHVFSRNVEIHHEKIDRYGRLVGRVLSDGKDINLEILKVGGAWFYWKYAKELPIELRESYPAAEAAAKAQKRGLWQGASPVPPWDWRKRGRENRNKEVQ